MTTITNTNTFTQDLCYPSKNEASYQASISSPHSTEYTEQPETEFSELSHDIKRTLSNSSKYYEEVATFEPINEPLCQASYNSRAVVKQNPNAQEDMNLQSPATTQAPSRKGSDDNCSDAEVEAEAEEADEEELEASELKDWSEKKDKILKNLAAKCKYDWKKIAKKFNTNENTDFTPLALKQRYKELTKVSIPLRVKFSHQEDLMIAKYFEVYGCDWTQISTHFTDRTAMMLKNRYYSHIRKKNLLASMLEEVKGDEPCEAQNTIEEEQEEVFAPIAEPVEEEEQEEEVAPQQPQQDEEEDDDTIKIMVEKPDGIYFKKVSINSFSRTFFELENSIPNVLFDKVTYSYY